MSGAPGGREHLSRLLHGALDAMERGDEADWRRHIGQLADAQTRSVVQRLGRLARELEQALVDLPPTPAQGSLDDARARLDHVVDMTGQATHRTLDLIEDSRALLLQLPAGGLSAPQAEIAARLRHNLQEMALAQSHQDLGGQIIRRVAGIVGQVHAQLGTLGLPPRAASAPSTAGHGPAVAGLDRGTVDQRDADDLLSHLGL